LAVVVVVAMMMLTVADVFMRYVFSRPIMGTTEITEYLMVCTLLAMAFCALENRHIKVDAVVQYLSPRAQAVVETITLIAGLGLIVILAWQGFEAGLYEMSYDVRSSMLQVPNFPFYVVLVVSFALLCLAIVYTIIRKVRGIIIDEP
jgi:TRAP-type C4-dicarboxylate transport system permease small subunit